MATKRAVSTKVMGPAVGGPCDRTVGAGYETTIVFACEGHDRQGDAVRIVIAKETRGMDRVLYFPVTYGFSRGERMPRGFSHMAFAGLQRAIDYAVARTTGKADAWASQGGADLRSDAA